MHPPEPSAALKKVITCSLAAGDSLPGIVRRVILTMDRPSLLQVLVNECLEASTWPLITPLDPMCHP